MADTHENRKKQKPNSPLFYYNCSHGASNDPCPIHFGGYDANEEPLHKPMPDNWMQSYVPPAGAEPGISDSVATKSTRKAKE